MMEDSFPKFHGSQRDIGRVNASEESVPDDLTNLNWVAGIPVPMNASLSPPEGVRARKLFYGSLLAKNSLGHHQINSPSTSNSNVVAKTKPLKVPLPTYKIVVKDKAQESLSHTHLPNNGSPEKRGSVILANVVSSGSDYNRTLEDLAEKNILDEDEECIVISDREGDDLAEICVDEEDSIHKKPICSYTCLIGMALKASNGCLPVNAIYQYIE